jgi:hypothetical protein
MPPALPHLLGLVNAVTVQVKYYFTSPVRRLTRIWGYCEPQQAIV